MFKGFFSNEIVENGGRKRIFAETRKIKIQSRNNTFNQNDNKNTNTLHYITLHYITLHYISLQTRTCSTYHVYQLIAMSHLDLSRIDV